MFASLACALALQVPIGQPPRLRTILSNGAVVLVERMPTATSLSVSLFVSPRGVDESPRRSGIRHLIEHFAAKGRRKDLDQRLETAGAFLYAHTLRDATQFEVVAPTNRLDMSLQAIGETMGLAAISNEELAREVEVIRQEGAIRDTATRMSDAAWRQAYGDQGLTPFGDPEAMRGLSFADVASVHRAEFVGGNLVVVVAGNVDLDEATAQAAKLLAGVPKGESPVQTRSEGKSGRVEIDGFCEARAAIVPSVMDPRTVAALAAGLAVASEVQGAFVTYTPSARNGLIIVGRTQENSGLGPQFDEADPNELFDRGRDLARRWIRRQFATPSAVAGLRGLMLVQGAGLRPETMLAQIDAMTPAQFRQGLKAYQDGNAVVVVGR